MLRSLSITALIVVVCACGAESDNQGDDAVDNGSGGSGGGSADTSGGTTGSGGAAPGSGGATGSTGGGTGTGGGTATCAELACAPDTKCVPDPDVCVGGGAPSCVALDEVECGDRPVCGCDRVVYESNCAALQAGASIVPTSLCEAPEGWITCQDLFCNADTEYCEDRKHYGSSSTPPCEAGASVFSSSCQPVPESCGGDPSCDCIGEAPFECIGTSGCFDNAGVTLSCTSGCFG